MENRFWHFVRHSTTILEASSIWNFDLVFSFMVTEGWQGQALSSSESSHSVRNRRAKARPQYVSRPVIR